MKKPTEEQSNVVTSFAKLFKPAWFMACVAWLLWGIDAAPAYIIFAGMMSLSSLLGIIPVIGVIGTWFVNTQYILPWVFSNTILQPHWIMALEHIGSVFISIVLTALSTYVWKEYFWRN